MSAAIVIRAPAPAATAFWGDAPRGLLRTAVDRSDADEDVVRACLGVLHKYIEVAVALECAGIDQLELGVELAAPPGHRGF